MDRLRAAPVDQDNIAARSSLGRGAAAAWRSSRRAKVARRQIDWLDAMKPRCRAMPARFVRAAASTARETGGDF
ncbi:hypothetical protein WS67_16460 [Burkholderia singularis]|uniref:Uncharacterized protein n=1 Tax=Burkholderia singularis TaxID=1503053 RepID=A0A118DNF7_9BURK|nr:hypothetical protein WS67_16460 [Burkholderia singularis]